MGKSSGSKGMRAVEELTYEEAFTELESVIAALESNDHTLDETMLLYERGQHLSKYLAKLLENAELKVNKLAGEKLTEFQEED